MLVKIDEYSTRININNVSFILVSFWSFFLLMLLLLYITNKICTGQMMEGNSNNNLLFNSWCKKGNYQDDGMKLWFEANINLTESIKRGKIKSRKANQKFLSIYNSEDTKGINNWKIIIFPGIWTFAKVLFIMIFGQTESTRFIWSKRFKSITLSMQILWPNWVE